MRSPTWRGNNNDFYSGLLLVTVATVALLYIRTLAIGTVLQMGPGYFPLGLALVLLGMGLCLVVKGLLTGEKPVGAFHLDGGRRIGLFFCAERRYFFATRPERENHWAGAFTEISIPE